MKPAGRWSHAGLLTAAALLLTMILLPIRMAIAGSGLLTPTWSWNRSESASAEIRIVPDEYPTLRAALTRIPSGSTVQIRAGVYREEVDITRHGITLEPAGDGPVWLDGECTRDFGIRVRGADDVTIRKIGIKRTVGQGILVQELSTPMRLASHVTIQGITVQDYNCRDAPEEAMAGIAIWYGGAGQRIIENTIVRRVELPGDQAGPGNGIWFKSSSAIPSGGGHTIADNVIIGGHDGIGGEPERDIHGSFDRETVIARNQIHTCRGDGIQVVGGTANLQVVDNVIEGCTFGIAFAPNPAGPLSISRNHLTGEGIRFSNDSGCFKRPGTMQQGQVEMTDNVCEVESPAP